MALRLVVLFALASSLLMAKPQEPLRDCCGPDGERLSPQQVKTLVHKTEPIHAPCCANMLHISGTVVLTISVGPKGDVTCTKMISGHPLIVGVAMDSVRRWKFQQYAPGGVKKSFCGQIALRFRADEHGVKYRVI